MYVKAAEITEKKWVKEESNKGIDRCKVKPLSDIAQNLVDMREYGLALPIYQKLADKYPKNEAAQYAQMMLGICYDGLGNSDKALEAYEAAIKKYKPYKGDSLFYYYGETLQKAGRYAEAEENYKKVINDPASYAWAVKSAQEGLDQIKRDSDAKAKQKSK
jgi:tetratricopeptide (TPR) repeat protein